MAKSTGKVCNKKDPSQWIFLMREECLKTGPDSENIPQFCKLRHPKTDEPSMFLFCQGDKEMYEVTSYSESFRSWFVDETVQEDGSLYMTTRVDPVYIALPYLIPTGKTNKFQILDQVITDEDFPECSRLCHCIEHEDLENIADTKCSGDIKAYRYSKDKTLEWLKKKVQLVADKLKDANINVSGGAVSHVFVRSKKTQQSSGEDYERYAHGMVSEYLPSDLSEELKQHMGIKDPDPPKREKPEIEEPPAKKAKKDGNVAPLEDYSQQSKPSEDVKDKKGLTSAQNKLKKVDTKGMKSISSFFSPKSKK